MSSAQPISDACFREVIHAQLWMQVMVANRSHTRNPARLDWQPDLEVHRNERFLGSGRDLDRDLYTSPEECAGERRLEDWLHKRGIVHSPLEPNDMSQYFGTINGSEPVLRASLAELEIDEDWIGETALRRVLCIGVRFSCAPGSEHYLCRLPVGWGTHHVPSHFAALIDALTQDGFCERLGAGQFSWTDKSAEIGVKTLPQIWNNAEAIWELRKSELHWIWNKMPLSIKSKYLRKSGPLDLLALDRDLTAFFDPATLGWSSPPRGARPRCTAMRHLADELGRFDQEVRLPGRERI